MGKRGKITCPKTLERLRLAREKGLATRRRRKKEKAEVKMLKELEDRKSKLLTRRKIDDMISEKQEEKKQEKKQEKKEEKAEEKQEEKEEKAEEKQEEKEEKVEKVLAQVKEETIPKPNLRRSTNRIGNMNYVYSPVQKTSNIKPLTGWQKKQKKYNEQVDFLVSKYMY